MAAPASTPFDALKLVAAEWGWARLRRYEHVMDDDVPTKRRPIVWYESGDSDLDHRNCYLQINECPCRQKSQYSVAVYAPRFGLCSGWYCFRLPQSKPANRQRILDLKLLVGKYLFASLLGRREFRVRCPECVGYSWKRICRHGAPYTVVDARAGLTERTVEREEK